MDELSAINGTVIHYLVGYWLGAGVSSGLPFLRLTTSGAATSNIAKGAGQARQRRPSGVSPPPGREQTAGVWNPTLGVPVIDTPEDGSSFPSAEPCNQ